MIYLGINGSSFTVDKRDVTFFDDSVFVGAKCIYKNTACIIKSIGIMDVTLCILTNDCTKYIEI